MKHYNALSLIPALRMRPHRYGSRLSLHGHLVRWRVRAFGIFGLVWFLIHCGRPERILLPFETSGVELKHWITVLIDNRFDADFLRFFASAIKDFSLRMNITVESSRMVSP
jgi:hypothetical protein